MRPGGRRRRRSGGRGRGSLGTERNGHEVKPGGDGQGNRRHGVDGEEVGERFHGHGELHRPCHDGAGEANGFNCLSSLPIEKSSPTE